MKQNQDNLTLQEWDSIFFEAATERFQTEQKAFIQEKWVQIRDLVCQNGGLKKWGKHILTFPTLPLLIPLFKQAVVGLEMKGFKLWKESNQDPHLEAIIRLFFDDDIGIRDVDFTMKEKLAFFWKHDPSIITQFRNRFEQIFIDLFDEVKGVSHDPLITQMLVGNLIALYPYFDPVPGEIVRFLDEQESNEWVLNRYIIQAIPLIKNKIYAYGMIPVDNLKATPLLLFGGTPYPAAKGFLQAILSDFDPLRSVGEALFIEGRTAIERWMQDKGKVKIYGLSLGATLAYQVGSVYGDRVWIQAYAAPGLLSKRSDKENLHGVAYHHLEDLVALVGYQPMGSAFKSYVIMTKAHRNFMLAHSRLAGYHPTLILGVNIKQANTRIIRSFLNLVRSLLSIALWTLFLPINFLIRFVFWSKKDRPLVQ